MSGEIKTQRLAGHIGAEIAGVDLSVDVSDDAVATLRSAVLEHHVIFLRDQFLGPERLSAMGKRFGDLLVNPLAPSVAGLPEVVELVNRDGGAPDVWHFDSSFLEAPPALSLLSMVTTPSVGGDTLWMSGYAALEALAPSMREFLRDLTVVYDSAATPQRITGYVAEHPLVAAHPETGRPALFFDPSYSTQVLELERAESDALLAFLRVHVTDPTFSCRFRWSAGTLAIWDNRCTLHRVINDFSGERAILRVTVNGDPPVRWIG